MDRDLTRALLALAALVLAAIALAPAPAGAAQLAGAPVQWKAWGRPLEPRGWTADGRFFVFTRRVEYWPLETIEDEGVRPLSLLFGVAIEARTGRERRWVLELTDADGNAATRPELDGPGPADFSDWLRERPLRLRKGRGLLLATTLVRGHAAGGEARVTWDESGAEVELPGKKAVRLELLVEAEGRTWPSIELRDDKGPLAGRVTPYWAPDGRRLAWVFAKRGETGTTTEYVVLAARGPRVEVVVSEASRPASPNVIAHLEDAGVYPVSLRTFGGVPLERTVIRYARGREEDAEVLADRLAGGALVEPMAAASTFELSIEPGFDLMMPPAPPFEELEEWIVPPREGPLVQRGDWRLGLFAALGVAFVVAALMGLGRPRR